MPWLVGIDEAGYGPNLGPLVQSSFALWSDTPAECPWEARAHLFRRGKAREDARLLVDDSKKVHDGTHGLARLERTVLGLLPGSALPGSYAAFLDQFTPAGTLEQARQEPWFAAEHALPVVQPSAIIDAARALVQSELEGKLHCRWIVQTPQHYNDLLRTHALKSNVLGLGVASLLAAALQLPGDDAVEIAVDRLGGRQYYGPMLQDALGGWPRARCETPELCDYDLLGLGREVRVRFTPRADSQFFAVAVASMQAKYVREVAMRQFNEFWAGKVPDLQPTAGYPVDALRFIDAISPAMEAQGIDRDAVWRRK